MQQISAKRDTTGWERWSIRNYAMNWNLTIRTSSIWTKKNPSQKKRRVKFSGVFEIQTNHVIPARIQDLAIIDKRKTQKNLLFSGVYRPNGNQSENEKKKVKRETNIWSFWKNKNCNWCIWNGPQMLIKRAGGFGNRSTSGDHQTRIIKIDQNTEFWRPTATQIPVKEYQLTLAWKRLTSAAQNNAIRTNHIKARIDKTQQKSKCRLFGDWDETINHIISECSKLAQKEYKTRHDWVGNKVPIWPYEQMVYAQPSTCPRKWHAQTPMGLWHTHGSPNLDQKTIPYNNQQQKKENFQNWRLYCPGWPQNKTERMRKEG